jgi:hypothetical protein
MICRINTGSDHFRVFRYILQEHKRATILETNIKGERLNSAILSRMPAISEDIKPILKELTHSFSQVKRLAPQIKNSMAHIKIGFDPQDGVVPRATKIAAAYHLLDHLGYDRAPRIVVDHHRDDPDHGYIHGFDHLHAVVGTSNYSGRHVHDSHNFTKAKEALREVETEYNLTPFIAKAERDQAFHVEKTEVFLVQPLQIIQIDASPIIRPTFEVIPYYEYQEPAPERMGR